MEEALIEHDFLNSDRLSSGSMPATGINHNGHRLRELQTLREAKTLLTDYKKDKQGLQ